MADRHPLRLLVACPECTLQHDASELAAGSRFHCECGQVLTVGKRHAHDADVVRCSSCGAPRQSEASSCPFCQSDFTLHEKDLNTICPGCATRISNSARFCHSCATPISPQSLAGRPTSRRCPVCGEKWSMYSRPVSGAGFAALECHRCAGIWIGHDVFRHLEEAALDREIGWNPSPRETVIDRAELPGGRERLYRRCPDCEQLMNRTNYGRRSGVIVDTCSQHGVWFDDGELSRILGWIRAGHWTEAQRRKILEDAELQAARRPHRGRPRGPIGAPPSGGAVTPLGRMLASVLEALFSR